MPDPIILGHLSLVSKEINIPIPKQTTFGLGPWHRRIFIKPLICNPVKSDKDTFVICQLNFIIIGRSSWNC